MEFSSGRNKCILFEIISHVAGPIFLPNIEQTLFMLILISIQLLGSYKYFYHKIILAYLVSIDPPHSHGGSTPETERWYDPQKVTNIQPTKFPKSLNKSRVATSAV